LKERRRKTTTTTKLKLCVTKTQVRKYQLAQPREEDGNEAPSAQLVAKTGGFPNAVTTALHALLVFSALDLLFA